MPRPKAMAGFSSRFQRTRCTAVVGGSPELRPHLAVRTPHPMAGRDFWQVGVPHPAAQMELPDMPSIAPI
jgi:hypothetical protein